MIEIMAVISAGFFATFSLGCVLVNVKLYSEINKIRELTGRK